MKHFITVYFAKKSKFDIYQKFGSKSKYSKTTQYAILNAHLNLKCSKFQALLIKKLYSLAASSSINLILLQTIPQWITNNYETICY